MEDSFFCQNAFASPDDPTPTEIQTLLQLDYQSFDQSLPSGGWRAIQDSFRAGQVLDSYLVQNNNKLSVPQMHIITWHAGQSYADSGLNKIAIARFAKSYDSTEGSNDRFKWNAYVRGSIAFLEHDREALRKARDEMRDADPSDGNVNRKVLGGFIKCFEKSYREAYGNCRPI